MHNRKTWLKIFLTLTIIWTFVLGGFLIEAQDFVLSRSIAGGSSVFSFPKSRKAPKRYARSSTVSRRTTQQRSSATRRVRRQYNTLARVTNRRDQIDVINPADLIPREDPKKASLALTGAGQYYFNEDQTEDAIKYFNEAYTLDKDNDLARLGLSDSLTRRGDELLDEGGEKVANAEYFYTRSIEVNAENSAAFAGLGAVYDELGDDEKAILNYEKALQIDPDLTEVSAPLGILYYQTNNLEKADIYLKRALVKEPDDSQTHYFLGLVRFTEEKFADAEKAFRKAVELDPESSEAHYFLGKTLANLNLLDDAIVEFREAIRINKNYVDALFDLGGVLYNTEKYQESVDAYSATVRVKNDYVEAYINLADGYRQLAERENNVKKKYTLLGQAQGEYELADEFIKNDPEKAKEFTEEEIADLYSRYGFTAGERNMLASQQGIRHTWDLAIGLLEKAAEITKSPIDYTNLGWAYYNSARNELQSNPDSARERLMKAKTYLETAKSLKPNAVNMIAVNLNLGITNIDLGNFKDAIENLKPVVAEREDWQFANYSLGVAYFKNGDMNDAITQFERAVSKQNDYVAALSGLGNAYLQLNKKKDVENVIARLNNLKTGEAVSEANRLKFALSQKR